MAATFEYNVDIDGFFDKIIQRSQQKINQAVDDALTELFREVKNELGEVYRQVIQEYYEDYVPQFYVRHHSLYNLIQFTENPDEIEWAFYPEKATPLERDYGTVYKSSFLYGWHGGASGEDHNGESVSTPHWRTPYPWLFQTMGSPRRRASVGYWRWGDEAYKSTSPYETWEERRADYIRENGRPMFIRILQQHINDIKWF